MATFRCQGQRRRSAFIGKSSAKLGASHQTHRCGKRGGKSVFVAGVTGGGRVGRQVGLLKKKLFTLFIKDRKAAFIQDRGDR